jgi:type VI secretion system protein ImpC
MNEELTSRLTELAHKYRDPRHFSGAFAVGVLGDFSGRTLEPRLAVEDRQFVDVELHRLDRFMAHIKPRVRISVENLVADGGLADVELEFHSFEDFTPESIVRRVSWLADERADARRDSQVSAILHHPDVQRLEATWRGLHHLALRLPGDGRVRIRVLDITKNELGKTLKKYSGAAWDQSPIFKKIYDQEFGTYGGCPFGLILGDYEVSHEPGDLTLLAQMSQISAAASAPSLFQASSRIFGAESFREAREISEPARLFQSSAFAAWRSFHESDDAKYVGLALPRILMRLPHCGRVRERIDGPHDLLWGNPVFGLGAEIASAFVNHLGFAAIPEVPMGGVLSGFDAFTFRDGQQVSRSSVEQEFSPEARSDLEALGLICLRKLRDNGRIAYSPPYTLRSRHCLENEKQNCFIPGLLVSGKIIHRLKALLRIFTWEELQIEHIQFVVDRWIAADTAGKRAYTIAEKMAAPLENSQCRVVQVEGAPGRFRVRAHLIVQSFRTHA